MSAPDANVVAIVSPLPALQEASSTSPASTTTASGSLVTFSCDAAKVRALGLIFYLHLCLVLLDVVYSEVS